MLKNIDYLPIKIKFSIKSKKLKTTLLIPNNSGRWLKKISKKILTLLLKLKNLDAPDLKLSEFFSKNNL